MDREWMSSGALQFALSSTSTVTTPSSGTFFCPRETLRLLHVTRGECWVLLAHQRERLVGDRMLLLFGASDYQIDQATEDLLLSQVDFSHMACLAPTPSLYEMYCCYADYRSLCHGSGRYYTFHDRFSLVRFTVKSLFPYTKMELPLRGSFLPMTLGYLMIVIACALQEKEHQPYQCNRHVRRAIQYIHENYMCNITAEDIASYIGIHAGHLHRLFRTEIGTRVTEYLINLRMEKAKTLLKRTDLPIADIAELVGISTQQYLSRLFKQHVCMTPQQYRRSYNITCDYDEQNVHYSTTVYEHRIRSKEPS